MNRNNNADFFIELVLDEDANIQYYLNITPPLQLIRFTLKPDDVCVFRIFVLP